jgi:hypothetical protein
VARAAPIRDPRYRPFRIAAYTVYLVIVSAFCLLVTASVIRSVLAMTPRRYPVRTAELDRDACVARADALFQELEEQRRSLGGAASASRADARWTSLRVEWLDRLRQAESSCGVGTPERAELAGLFRELEHLEDLYTTSAVQYSGEVGPALDAFRRDLDRARRAH